MQTLKLVSTSDPLLLLDAYRSMSAQLRSLGQELTNLREDRAVVGAMLRHDLRHPIQAITAASDLLMNDDFEIGEEEQREMLTMITDEAYRMSRMIDEAFEDSVSSADNPAKLKTVDMPDFLGGVAVEMRRTWTGGLRVEVDQVEVRTDPDLLLRAVLNLVDNAQKYAPEKSTIEIVGSSVDAGFSISVIDEGSGVDPAQEPFLFTAFASDISRSDSTGLGLLSVARTMERLGGRAAYARLNDRTVFELVIPALS